MTTAAPSPLAAFRSSRDLFLNSVVSGVSGLESAVLEFEQEHARRTAAAESEAARLRDVNADLLAELGEKEEALQEARAGAPVVNIPAAAEDPAALAEARETIRQLESRLAERPEADASEDRGGPQDAAEIARLKLELAGAGETISAQARSLQEEARLREQLADEARSRREEYDLNVAGLKTDISELEEDVREAARTLEERTEAARTAARAEALNVIKAVAADSPDTPLEEAMDMVIIAMDVPPEAAGKEETSEPAAADDGPAGSGLEIPELETDHDQPPLPFEGDDSFFASLAPPVVQEEASIFGTQDEPEESDRDGAGLEPQLMFDIDDPEEAERGTDNDAPKPGFGMFRKNTGQAA